MTILASGRTSINDEMEGLLLLWIKEKEITGDTLTQTVISHKHVFNCEETGLFRKKMPRRSYITAEEKKLPSHKPMKDRLTLAFCAKASGDLKIKSLLVYHTENPRAFKAQNITKERLLVFLKSNSKAWVTRTISLEWINVCFGPAVKNFLEENNLLLKCLLVLDNAPAHPPGLEDIIHPDFFFIKVLYLPPNTTLCSIYGPETVVAERDLEGSNPSNEDEAVDDPAPDGDVEEIISIRRSMGLVIDEAAVHKLIEEHSEALKTEDLKELEAMQLAIIQEEHSSSSGENGGGGGD
ncbi:tigger transposable element-derived protein 1-like [Palaemon carinicauda]|uniref:tigger transposable element-derived protein 1-like n=1 Tax=Palaemon carinicauda TaxID=392227 RepID=UPI0035B5C369